MSFQFQKLNILVVEDTVPMRKLICSVLETMGVGKVYTANDGETGFKVFCEHNPDIVIVDWHMEPQDGMVLIDMIRRDARSPNRMVPIIMMTGYSAFKRVSKARDQGVTEFLVKPFSASDIARRLVHIINRPRDFIDSKDFFGPDRRRVNKDNFNGPYRRKSDGHMID